MDFADGITAEMTPEAALEFLVVFLDSDPDDDELCAAALTIGEPLIDWHRSVVEERFIALLVEQPCERSCPAACSIRTCRTPSRTASPPMSSPRTTSVVWLSAERPLIQGQPESARTSQSAQPRRYARPRGEVGLPARRPSGCRGGRDRAGLRLQRLIARCNEHDRHRDHGDESLRAGTAPACTGPAAVARLRSSSDRGDRCGAVARCEHEPGAVVELAALRSRVCMHIHDVRPSGRPSTRALLRRPGGTLQPCAQSAVAIRPWRLTGIGPARHGRLEPRRRVTPR